MMLVSDEKKSTVSKHSSKIYCVIKDKKLKSEPYQYIMLLCAIINESLENNL